MSAFGFQGNFDPASQIPDLSNRVVLVTGATSGLGRESALRLARKHPAKLFITSRTIDRATSEAADIQKEVPNVSITPIALDLESLSSVRSAAETILNSADRLDIVMNNAGNSSAGGISSDGYEAFLASNYLGPALLTKLLLPRLLETAKKPDVTPGTVRVVFLSSLSHTSCPNGGILFDSVKTSGDNLSIDQKYGQAKLGINLLTRQLARLHPQITFVAVHPGAVKTRGSESYRDNSGFVMRTLVRLTWRMFLSVEDGAKNQLWAAVSDEVISGEYYMPIGVSGKANAYSKDDALMKKLWDWTETELAAY